MPPVELSFEALDVSGAFKKVPVPPVELSFEALDVSGAFKKVPVPPVVCINHYKKSAPGPHPVC